MGLPSRREVVEISLVAIGCATVAWAMQQIKAGQLLSREASAFMGLTTFVAASLTSDKFRTSLPKSWLQVSRTCPDNGIIYVLLGPLVSASVLMALAQCESSFILDDKIQYARALFWVVWGSTIRFVIRAGEKSFPILRHADNTDSSPKMRIIASLVIDILISTTSGIQLGFSEAGTDRIGTWFCGCLTLCSLFLQRGLLALWLRGFQKSFTVGEAYCVALLISFAILDFVLLSVEKLASGLSLRAHLPFGPFKERLPEWVALEGGLLGVLALPLVMSTFLLRHAVLENETVTVDARVEPPVSATFRRKLSTPETAPLWSWDKNSFSMKDLLTFWAVVIAWLGGVVSIWVSFLLKWKHPVIFVVEYVFSSTVHLGILGYWILALSVGLPCIHVVASRAQWPLIITRKLYHLLALAMFAPAIVSAPTFLAFSFGIAMALLFFIELIRICRVPPFGNWIHVFLRSYTDSRDEGTTILTHIYLLLGCALPLWLYADIPIFSSRAAQFAGLAILGAGDAAGAIIGSQVGKYSWPGGRKTLEGTIAAVCASLGLMGFLLSWAVAGCEHDVFNTLALVCATLLTCLLEAFTKQIDNLTLPMFYAALLVLPAVDLHIA